jgi:hypothetical protein
MSHLVGSLRLSLLTSHFELLTTHHNSASLPTAPSTCISITSIINHGEETQSDTVDNPNGYIADTILNYFWPGAHVEKEETVSESSRTSLFHKIYLLIYIYRYITLHYNN